MKRAALTVVALSLVAAACSGPSTGLADLDSPQIRVVAEGLLNPIGLAAHPDGGILIAEEGTGGDDLSAGVSMLTADGRLGRVVSGLPSSRDSGDLSGAPLVGISPDGRTAYVAHFNAGSLLTFPAVGLEPETKARPALGPEDLTPAMVSLNEVDVVNPFDITFAADGRPVVSDASENGAAIETGDGATRFFHRFGELEDPEAPERKIDPVPTGIERIGNEFYVTLTGGCPFPTDSGQLVAIDLDRNQRVVVDRLNMPIDIARATDGTIWLLEFARFEQDTSCFTGEGYRSGTGRLSRVSDSGEVVETVAGLDFPGAVLPMPDGSLYVSEVFGGRILHLTWGEEPDAGATPATADPVWRFTDVAASVGIDFVHGSFRTGVTEDPVAMMGAGLCWIDFDDDGWLDLYLVNSHATAEVSYWEDQGGLPTNSLYRNTGGAFEDVTSGSGADLAIRGNGCVAADFDGDGDSDLFVTADGPDALLVNDGDGSFTDIGISAGIAAESWSTAAVVGDVNGDGLADLFVGSYIDLARKIDKPSGAFPQDFVGIADHFYLNQGGTDSELRFRDVTTDAGLIRNDRALGALLTDIDDDADLDLYVANDGQANRLYRNDSTAGSTPRFVDVTDEAGVGDSGSGMGVAGGDFDMDGSFDLLVTNWETELNALYTNRSSGSTIAFDYMTYRVGIAGLGNNKTAWGATWADFDLDTDLDLLVVHGRVPVADLEADAELVRLYGNQAVEGLPAELRDWTRLAGLDSVGEVLARGSAVADFDNDGDMDVAINVVGGHALLVRNDNPPGHWLGVALPGFHPGAVVTVTLSDGTELRQEWHVGSSYLASEDPRFRFGLGSADEPVSVSVRWPDGSETVRTALDADQQHIIER